MSRPARATARPSLPVSSARPVTVSGAAALVSPFAAGLLVLGLLFKNSPELLRSGTTVLFVLLPSVGAPTFYDKLLPVPLLNLMVRFLDRVADSRALARLDPSRIAEVLTPVRRNAAYTSLWAGVFVALSLTQGVGDRHPEILRAIACRQGWPDTC